ncbi:hypothetical protein NC653_036028 [Populus alba x Populus x berolinensis]|uniref:Uncharacterized protein n=1 Tax=Populus alba x Populus x berolinensis TaxID=444605 RepID=A0AAD6LJ44_9ROSI|nr:hypothetical protein NC653_036028 [Populus alba x Populus x berolinensis]
MKVMFGRGGIFGFTAFAGVACNLLPKLLAIVEGLELAWDREYRKIMLLDCYLQIKFHHIMGISLPGAV